MPLYEFEHTQTGERREFVVPLGTQHMRCRDGCWKRVETVNRIAIPSSSRGETSQKDEVIAGYYEKECREGSRFKSRFSKSQIKRTWATA